MSDGYNTQRDNLQPPQQCPTTILLLGTANIGSAAPCSEADFNKEFNMKK